MKGTWKFLLTGCFFILSIAANAAEEFAVPGAPKADCKSHLDSFKPFKPEAMEYLKTNVGAELLVGQRIRIKKYDSLKRKEIDLTGDVLDVWGTSVSRHFLILNLHGKIEEYMQLTGHLPFSARIWGTKETNPNWPMLQAFAQTLRNVIVNMTTESLKGVLDSYGESLKQSLPDSGNWMINSFTDGFINDYGAWLGQFVIGIDKPFDSPELVSGLVTQVIPSLNKSGGWNVEMRISPLDGSKAKVISFDKAGRIPILLAYKKSILGSKSQLAGEQSSNVKFSDTFKGSLF